MNYTMTAPCPHCPFRTDIRPFLHRERAYEIARAITVLDQTFECHKTIGRAQREKQHCAGAMILLEKIGRPNQMMRIAERIGLYDRTRLQMNAPVFDTAEAFIIANGRG